METIQQKEFIFNQKVRLVSNPKRDPEHWADDYIDNIKGPLVAKEMYGKDMIYVMDLGNDNIQFCILLENIEKDPTDKRSIPKTVTGMVNDLISNFPNVNFEDRGTGGFSYTNHKTEGLIKPVFISHDSERVGVYISDMKDIVPLWQIQDILDGKTNKAHDSFQATQYTHITRTWTFFKEGEELPEESSCSW